MKKLLKILLVGAALLSGNAWATESEKVGVIFGSFGDVDEPKSELRDLVRLTLTDPDVLPLHPWITGWIADLGWYIERSGLLAEYEAIGGKSGMRQRSQEQAEAVAARLRQDGLNAVGYAGFTMTFPFVSEALDKARKDGVTKLIVIYQGAQYSKVTAQIVFRHVREYLKAHPKWQVVATGLRSFTDDQRFIALIKSQLNEGIRSEFDGISEGDVCVFLPLHGLVDRLVREGDPYVPQVMRIVDELKDTYGADRVFYGYQNHDEIPFVGWTQPTTDKALSLVAAADCRGVLINGGVSFTVDSLETLYDHRIDEPARLAEEARRLGRVEPKIVVQPMFNSDPEFVELMATKVREALTGQGDLEAL